MRRIAGKLLIDFRISVEMSGVVLLVGALLLAGTDKNFSNTLSDEVRRTMYGSLAGTSGALLGFVLAALSILIALPSSERMDALREHPKWERVPGSYFRAAWALLGAVALCTLGIAVDSDKSPWQLYEAATVAVLALCLVRVAAVLVALDAIISVARQQAPRAKRIGDPGL